MSNGCSREHTISIPTADFERLGPWISAEQPSLRAKSGHKLQPIDHFSTNVNNKRSKKHAQSAIVTSSPKIKDVKRVSISAIDGNSAKLLNINNTVLVTGEFIIEKEKCQLLVRTDAQLSPVSKIVLDTNKIPNPNQVNIKTKKDFIYKKNDLYYPESSKSPIFDVKITASRRVSRDLSIDLHTLYDKTYRPTLKLPRCKHNDNRIATINPHFIHGPITNRGQSKGALSSKRLPKLNSNSYTNGESLEEYLISPAIKRSACRSNGKRAAVYTVKDGATISYLPYNAWTKKK